MALRGDYALVDVPRLDGFYSPVPARLLSLANHDIAAIKASLNLNALSEKFKDRYRCKFFYRRAKNASNNLKIYVCSAFRNKINIRNEESRLTSFLRNEIRYLD